AAGPGRPGPPGAVVPRRGAAAAAGQAGGAADHAAIVGAGATAAGVGPDGRGERVGRRAAVAIRADGLVSGGLFPPSPPETGGGGRWEGKPSCPLPPWGGGLGWGVDPQAAGALPPHPNPPPQGGRGQEKPPHRQPVHLALFSQRWPPALGGSE